MTQQKGPGYVSAFGGRYEAGPEGRVEARGYRIQVVCNLEELGEFKAAAHKAQTSLSSWARQLMLAECARAADHEDKLRALKQAHGIRDDEPEAPRKTLGRPRVQQVLERPVQTTRPGTVIDLDEREAPSFGGLFDEFDDEDEGDGE